ncbi:MAG: 5-formyltetrahydrofolate cyclo-ligase [Spirochaetales bacterium]
MHPEDNSLPSAKRALRREMRQRLSLLPRERHQQAGTALLDYFGASATGAQQNPGNASDPAVPAGRLFAFASMRGEINTWPLLHSYWEAGLSVALPKVEPGGIAFFLVAGTHELSPGTLGIAEPSISCPPAVPAAGDTVLVPGLAFTRDGARLGRGGGYYDRFIASLVEGVTTVGVCYDVQILESLPCGERDMHVGTVVSL